MAGQEVGLNDTLRNGPARGRRGSDAQDLAELGNQLIPDAIHGFQQASATHQIETVAGEAAELAETQRMAAEGLQAEGVADPLEEAVSIAGGQRDTLSDKEREVQSISDKTFSRYKNAVLQGATNSQAARIAVQKEMRNLISRYPVHADVIRRAAANATGNDEFLVRSRDVAAPKRQELTEYQKGYRNVESAVETAYGHLRATNKAEYERIRATKLSQYHQTFEAQQAIQHYESLGDLKGVDLNLMQENYRATDSQLINVALQNLNSALEDGDISEEEWAAVEDQIRSTMVERLDFYTGLALKTDKGPEYAESFARSSVQQYQHLLDTMEGSNPASRIANYNKWIEQGLIKDMREAFPLQAAADVAFGENAELVLDIMLKPTGVGDLALHNSPLFAETRQEMMDMGYEEPSADQIRYRMLRKLQRNVENTLSGKPGDPAINAQHLTLVADLPPELREEAQQNIVERMATQEQQTLAGIVGETSGKLNNKEIAVIKQASNEWTHATNRAREEVEKYTDLENGKVAFAVLVEQPDGKGAIEIRRYTKITDGDKERWAEMGGTRPLFGKDAYGILFGAYKDGKGNEKRLVERADVRIAAWGGDRNPTEVLANQVAAINGASGIDLPPATYFEPRVDSSLARGLMRGLFTIAGAPRAVFTINEAVDEWWNSEKYAGKRGAAPVPSMGPRRGIDELLNEQGL